MKPEVYCSGIFPACNLGDFLKVIKLKSCSSPPEAADLIRPHSNLIPNFRPMKLSGLQLNPCVCNHLQYATNSLKSPGRMPGFSLDDSPWLSCLITGVNQPKQVTTAVTGVHRWPQQSRVKLQFTCSELILLHAWDYESAKYGQVDREMILQKFWLLSIFLEKCWMWTEQW